MVAVLREQIEPAGRVVGDLDLRSIARVFPLVTIPQWVASQLYYGLLSRLAMYLLLPLLVGYVGYQIVAYLLVPNVRVLLTEIAWDAGLLVAVAVLFLVVLQRTAARTPCPCRAGVFRAGGTRSSVEQIQDLLVSDRHPPLHRDLHGRQIGVFVSGHTHDPALSRLDRGSGQAALIANSGCWLRQLHPVPARFGALPVFVSTFVQTHVRIRLDGSGIRVELWEHPRPARDPLRVSERVAILGRRPVQPAAGAPSRLVAADALPVPGTPPNHRR